MKSAGCRSAISERGEQMADLVEPQTEDLGVDVLMRAITQHWRVQRVGHWIVDEQGVGMLRAVLDWPIAEIHRLRARIATLEAVEQAARIAVQGVAVKSAEGAELGDALLEETLTRMARHVQGWKDLPPVVLALDVADLLAEVRRLRERLGTLGSIERYARAAVQHWVDACAAWEQEPYDTSEWVAGEELLCEEALTALRAALGMQPVASWLRGEVQDG